MLRQQEIVKEFCEKYNLGGSAEIRLMDTLSELGEVAKEILKGNAYGSKPFEPGENLESEMGDLFFSLLTLANELGVSLDEALNNALRKYERRLQKGSAGSESEGK